MLSVLWFHVFSCSSGIADPQVPVVAPSLHDDLLLLHLTTQGYVDLEVHYMYSLHSCIEAHASCIDDMCMYECLGFAAEYAEGEAYKFELEILWCLLFKLVLSFTDLQVSRNQRMAHMFQCFVRVLKWSLFTVRLPLFDTPSYAESVSSPTLAFSRALIKSPLHFNLVSLFLPSFILLAVDLSAILVMETTFLATFLALIVETYLAWFCF